MTTGGAFKAFELKAYKEKRCMLEKEKAICVAAGGNIKNKAIKILQPESSNNNHGKKKNLNTMKQLCGLLS